MQLSRQSFATFASVAADAVPWIFALVAVVTVGVSALSIYRRTRAALRADALCRAAATQQLLSPGSARFLPDSGITALNDTSGMISEVVDSQNEYGALLRSAVVCFMSRDGPNDEWRIGQAGVSIVRR